jgi:2-polyprenyl-3-methyl-5-hydroxy-6-metoxy-1,4-benzoquinol methylase
MQFGIRMKNAENFWNEKHKKTVKYWLTGTKLKKLWDWHELECPIGQTTMEIGVGMGHLVKTMAASKNKVYAVDISQVALDKLAEITENRYLTKDMDSIPDSTMDFIVCHLVLCHCDTPMVEYLIKQAIRTLKSGGVASFHTADSSSQTSFVKEQVDSGLVFFRPHKQVKDIIERNNGYILDAIKRDTSDWAPSGTKIEGCVFKFSKKST